MSQYIVIGVHHVTMYNHGVGVPETEYIIHSSPQLCPVTSLLYRLGLNHPFSSYHRNASQKSSRRSKNIDIELVCGIDPKIPNNRRRSLSMKCSNVT